MNAITWVFSIVLAVVFLVVGVIKAFRYETANKMLTWVKDVPRPVVLLIGVLEILLALGMVAPAVIGANTMLSVYAAGGLAVLMLSATTFHMQRRETDAAALTGLLMLMAGFVAYGHWTLLPPM